MGKILYTPQHIKDPKNHYRRIYFSSHPKDAILFKTISEDIRKIEKDCVIAHMSSYDDPIDDLTFSELSEFHLIVIPVTEEWLAWDSLEFDFFIKSNKAIIPILMDEALEKEFNEKTNNLQFLCKTDEDYYSKLRKYLEDILFDPKMIDDIKKVFTHKLFVSYCREDIKYAQELIRHIHSEESARKISIWYDKYLPAGKNFEESIYKEIDNCNFFGITVTPNMVSRENYVKNNEYPRAIDTDKKIIFFELCKTEHDKVKAQFKDAEKYEYVSPSAKSFPSYIRKLLKKQKGLSDTREKNEKDLLLGLAYLNGIFVEIDYDYATKKLEASANGGNISAAQTLGNIFYRGIGMKRDVEKALAWYKTEIELSKKAYQTIFESLKELKKYPLVSMDKETHQIHTADEDTLELFTKIVDAYIKSTDDLIRLYYVYTNILRTEGEYKTAIKYYHEALDIIRLSDENFSKLEMSKKYRARIENELHLLLMMLGENDSDNLKNSWSDSIEQYKQNNNDKTCAFNSVKSAHNYGLALLREKKPQKAREIMMEAINISENFIDDKSIYELLLLLHRDIGRSYISDDENCDADEAIKWFESEKLLLENYKFDMDENPYLYFGFSWNHFYLGEAYDKKNDIEKAFEHYFKALMVTEDTEKKIGEKCFTSDFPFCFLQLYSYIFLNLSQFINNVSDEFLCSVFQKIQDVAEHFGSYNFNSDQKDIANTYKLQLLDALENFRNK